MHAWLFELKNKLDRLESILELLTFSQLLFNFVYRPQKIDHDVSKNVELEKKKKKVLDVY